MDWILERLAFVLLVAAQFLATIVVTSQKKILYPDARVDWSGLTGNPPEEHQPANGSVAVAAKGEASGSLADPVFPRALQ